LTFEVLALKRLYMPYKMSRQRSKGLALLKERLVPTRKRLQKIFSNYNVKRPFTPLERRRVLSCKRKRLYPISLSKHCKT
jgi:hypothetical protein